MKLSEIKDFLEGRITLQKFKENILTEINIYEQNVKKKGATASIVLEEDCKLFISREYFLLILNEYQRDRLNSYVISYIVDAILLSENVIVEDEEILELLESLTDQS